MLYNLQDEFGTKLAEEDETGGAEGDKVVRRISIINTTDFQQKQQICRFLECLIMYKIINRPGVARAVLQTHLSFIN